jgi:hypothetical protein
MRWKPSGPEPVEPQNPYRQGFLHRRLATLLIVLERSSDDSLSASFLSSSYIYYYFLSFPMSREIQTKECCKTIREWFGLNITL